MEFVFKDYCNWKLENEKLITRLIEDRSNIIYRFKHVYDVVEYYSNQMIAENKLQEEEMLIFEMGFKYLFEAFQNITIILEDAFNNDIDKMEEEADLINLYLCSLDFSSELLNSENADEKAVEKLNDFSTKLFGMIKNKENTTTDLTNELDEITVGAFKDEYYGVVEIFLDIADEIGLLDYE